MTVGNCPGCGSGNTKDLGEVPSSSTFAGRAVPPMPARLGVCRDCHLGFKSPQPSLARLAQLYAAGSDSAWLVEEEPRPDWRAAAQLVGELGSSTVLDVGCFDGAFFDQVDVSVGRFGVEINPDAAARARGRGVDVVAADLNDLAKLGREFDCVVAFDVIEHVHDPAAFLAELGRVAKTGGHVILATGNFFAPTQRLMGSRYLYSWYQEHIAFVSPRWMQMHAPRLGFNVVRVTRFSHHPRGVRGFLVGSVKNAVYRLAPGLLERLRARFRDGEPGAAVGIATGPPAWLSARDHFIVLLEKSGSTH